MAATNANTNTSDDASVASASENAKLKHSVGGVTTRDDALDLGVPMLGGDPKEPVGPEDALGVGSTRGDYRERVGSSAYRPHTVVPVPDAKPGEPTVRVVAQRPLAEDIGEVAGKKGGVETE